MEEAIRRAYNQCKVDEALDWGDKRYVDLNGLGVRGTDHSCTEFLFHSVEMSDRATHQLFSGFRGCGKTTELKHLARRFSEAGYNVIYVDADAYLNLRVPTNISDILVTVCAGVDSFLEDGAGDKERPMRRFWDRLHAFLNNEVKAEELTLGAAGVNLKLSFKDNVDFKTKLYQAVQARIPELAHECQAFLDESLGVLAELHPDNQGTVLILDSFEKLRGDLGTAAAVRASIEEVFIQNWKYLQTPFHAIYTVPPWMAFMEAGTAAEFGQFHMLPMCKVYDRGHNQDEKGVDALLELLDKRFVLDDVFASRAPIVELILASGGYPRDLLRMVREVLLRAGMEERPVPIQEDQLQGIVDLVIAGLSEQFEAALDDSDTEALAAVAEKHSLAEWGRDNLQRLADLFDHHFVLSYRNGKTWYDVHPLLLLSRTGKLPKAIEKRREQQKD